MHRVPSPSGADLVAEVHGSGPPLVLVHGSFSDHRSNWVEVLPDLARTWTVYAVARRGRGGTTATLGHSVVDEAVDVVALLRSLDRPAHVLGHSYGAQVALAAAWLAADRVDHLVLYEPPVPEGMPPEVVVALADHAGRGAWDEFADAFFRGVIGLDEDDLDGLRGSGEWPGIVGDAPASWGDLQALSRYRFTAEAFARLEVPTLLQAGTESPAELFATDALARLLPAARVDELTGQGHEAMTTSPAQYLASVRAHLPG